MPCCSSCRRRTTWRACITLANSSRSVSIVGSTGSIGTQALDVIRASKDEFEVVALGAYRSVEILAGQIEEFHPKVVAVVDEQAAKDLVEAIPAGTEVLVGEDALRQVAELGDTVLNAVVGFAGLPVTLAALRSGRRLALANPRAAAV